MSDSTDYRIERYKRLLDLSDSEIASSRAIWKLIEPHMGVIIEKFYNHLARCGLMGYFDQTDLPKLKLRQLEYWRNLFNGEFRTTHSAHIRKIRIAHLSKNVGLAEYIAAYYWFAREIFSEIGGLEELSSTRINEYLRVVSKIMFLDMIVAVSVQDDAIVDI